MLYRYVREWIPYALLRETDAFGIRELDLAAPPTRFGLDQRLVPDEIAIGVDEQNVERLLTPCELAAGLPAGDNWHAQSKRTLGRLDAWFLVCEDPQRRLDVRRVATLGHQASLVRHILDNPDLDRVLIAEGEAASGASSMPRSRSRRAAIRYRAAAGRRPAIGDTRPPSTRQETRCAARRRPFPGDSDRERPRARHREDASSDRTAPNAPSKPRKWAKSSGRCSVRPFGGKHPGLSRSTD